MSTITPEIWMKLTGDQIQGAALRARYAVPDTTTRLLAALDVDGVRHLLVLLNIGEKGMQDSRSRGLAVDTRELAIPGHEAGTYLDITCNDTAGYEMFDLIGSELSGRLVSTNNPTSEIVGRVLAKWRRFWGQSLQQMLSHEEQLGLFAELWFLLVWLIPKIGQEESIIRWRGPYGARHDFEWLGGSIEVKATTSVRGRIHTINGVDQLLPPENGGLKFFSLRLREEAGASNTLPSIVNACRTQFEINQESLGQFEIALARANYSPAHEEEYVKLRLRIVEEGLYRVEENFPRITTNSFESGVPDGVERIDYEINIGNCEHLLLADGVAGMPDL